MSNTDFTLDPRLAADTCPVASLPLCDVRLMNDARFPWLVLIPRQQGLVEIADLSEADQAALWQEVSRTSAALRNLVRGEKLNLGALGNIVRQLHVHLVVRHEGDAAWPGPVWGHGSAEPYCDDAREDLIKRLRKALDMQGS